MSITELELKIKKLGIPPQFYSLNGALIYGIVLDKLIEPNWYRVFSLDEHGRYNYEQKFNSEEEACEYMYKRALFLATLLPEETKNRNRNLYFDNNPPKY